jgi:hypothetical protein
VARIVCREAARAGRAGEGVIAAGAGHINAAPFGWQVPLATARRIDCCSRHVGHTESGSSDGAAGEESQSRCWMGSRRRSAGPTRPSSARAGCVPVCAAFGGFADTSFHRHKSGKRISAASTALQCPQAPPCALATVQSAVIETLGRAVDLTQALELGDKSAKSQRPVKRPYMWPRSSVDSM